MWRNEVSRSRAGTTAELAIEEEALGNLADFLGVASTLVTCSGGEMVLGLSAR